ncbi:MAG: hypothetical protein PHF00_04055, partial [Elusimicrobia bacterium]|nr:hypothetical protein [Elusimicrobiota bacterium]
MGLWRKVLAAALCACMLAPAPGLAAAPPAPDDGAGVAPTEVLRFLDAHGAFKGPDDPVRQYVGNDKFITPLGAALYRELQARYNPKEEIEGMQESFKALARSGPYSDKKAAVFKTALERYRDKFGALPQVPDADGEDTFRLGTLREMYMTGAAAADAPKAEYSQVDLPGDQGHEFWDKNGVAFILNKNKVTVYNRELQKMQRQLNKARPAQAPFIPETGRYSQQMFLASYWRLKLQCDQLDMAMRLDRMLNIAELLGDQKKDQVWFDPKNPNQINAELEKALIEKAKAKPYSHKGRKYSIWDIAEAKTRLRADYLGKASEGVSYFKAETDKLKGADSITDQKIKTMEMGEQYVMRYLSLSFLETQKFALRNQLERLNRDSPDSQMLEESLEKMPLDEAGKARYRAEAPKARARLERLLAVLGRVEDVLFATDYASNLDLASAALSSSQKEIGESGQNYELFVTAPAMLLALANQTGSYLPKFNGSLDPRQWSWGWGKKLAADSKLAKGYSGDMKRVERLVGGGKAAGAEGFEEIARMISNGDYRSARKAVIALDPDAVYARPALALSGEAARVTDSARLTAALKSARETLGRVAEINRWVNMADNFITWSVSVGLAAPVLRTAFAGVEVAAYKFAAGMQQLKIPYVSTPVSWVLKGIGAASEQVRLRLASLEPAQEKMRQTGVGGPLARYLRN